MRPERARRICVGIGKRQMRGLRVGEWMISRALLDLDVFN
jgi:hypothetical protein